MAHFYQFCAKEMYKKVVSGKSGSDSDGSSESAAIGVCPEILVLFSQNLAKYNNRTLKFHASLLGIEELELRYTIKALTGSSFTDFLEDFLVFKVQDVLGDYPEYGSLREKARLLGFTYLGLYNFMKRKMERTPRGWKWN